jgi:hypothetical protein
LRVLKGTLLNQIGKIAIFIDGANLYGCDANAIALPNRSNAQRLDQSLAHNLSRERNRRSPRGLVDRNGTRIEKPSAKTRLPRTLD